MDDQDRLTTPEELADYDQGCADAAYDVTTGARPRDVMHPGGMSGAYWRGYYNTTTAMLRTRP